MAVLRVLPVVLLAACVGRTELPSAVFPGSGESDVDLVTGDGSGINDGDGSDSGGDPVIEPPSNGPLFFQAYANQGTLQLQGFGVDDAGNAITGGTANLPWNGMGYASTFVIDRVTTDTQTLVNQAWAGSWSPNGEQLVGAAIPSNVEIRDMRAMTNGEAVFCASLTGGFVDKGGVIYSSPNSRQSPVIALRTLDGDQYNSRQFENQTSANGVQNAQCQGVGADSARTYIVMGGLYGASVDLGFGPVQDAITDPNGFTAMYRYDSLTPLWAAVVRSSQSVVVRRAAVDTQGRSFFGINHQGDLQPYGLVTIGTNGAVDIALYAYDFTGTFVFATGYGSPNDDTVSEVLTDGDGNSYVCGTHSGTMLRYDGSALPSHTFGGGQSDGHVMKLDPNGNILWLRTAGGIGNDSCSGLTLSKDGTTLLAVGAIATPAAIYGPTVVASGAAYVAFLGTDGSSKRDPLLLSGTGPINLRGADFDPTTGAVWMGGSYSGTMTWGTESKPQINSNSSSFVGRIALPIGQ